MNTTKRQQRPVNILVTGANGQLGNEIRDLENQYKGGFSFTFTDVAELDLLDAAAVEDFCQTLKPAYIINCAAYTAVDKAEDDEAMCRKINRDAVLYLAEAAESISAKIIHISTDYVFDGSQTQPYQETDPVCPVSVYGKTKLEGEEVLQKNSTQYLIIRTAWLYSEYGNNFVKTMLRLGKEKEVLQVVNDQVGSPTYAGDLAKAIMDIVSGSESGRFIKGMYHYSNQGICSWFEFTKKIHALAGITTCQVLPIAAKDYPAKAPRPAYSVLSKDKIIADYGITVPQWEDSLAVCIARLHS